MKKLSVVIPCFNEEEVIEKFHEEVTKILKRNKIDFELVFVNDGSKDKTLTIIKNLSKKDSNIKYVSFSKNFGKEAGILAGLEHACGDYVVVMDSDLQHDPNLLPEMYEILKSEEFDSVAVRRTNRKEGLRGILSKLFFKFMSKLSGLDIHSGEMDYRMMNRIMVDSILDIKEYNRFSKGIFSFVGFKTKWLEQENIEREYGSTKWNYKSLIKYSLEGITSFSTSPLKLSTIIGVLFFIVSLIFIIILAVKSIFFDYIFIGTSLVICSIFLCSGIQLLCFGIMSEYLSKMYFEVKNRPVYIVKETNIEAKRGTKNEKM